MRLLAIPLLLTLLAACSGGGAPQRATVPALPAPGAGIAKEQRSLVFAYPAAGQTEVAPAAPIVLRFSHPLTATADAIPALVSLRAAGDSTDTAYAASFADGKRSLILQPSQPLREQTTYSVTGTVPLESGDTPLQVPGKAALNFTTRAAFEGPGGLQRRGGQFGVVQLLPERTGPLIGDKPFGPLEFSTLRLQMTQPIDPRTAIYGDTVNLRQGSDLVPARLLVTGNHLTIDPVNDLDAGKGYSIVLAPGLRSSFGAALTGGYEHAFTPMSVGTQTRVAITLAKDLDSRLLGSPVNQVPVASPVLGQGANAPKPQAGGTLAADLAELARFRAFDPAIIPLRVPRNNVLRAGNLEVKLDGQVPAGLNTGDLTIRLISDANGILLPNRYSYALEAPGLVMLEMDISVSAQDSTSNGAFTQNILHVQAAGIATIDQARNVLRVEAVSTLELKVLGVDNAVGVLALEMESDLKPGAVIESDTVAPAVQSWVPGAVINDLPGGEFLRPGDPMMVNFTEAMDPASFLSAGALALTRDGGVPEPFSWRLDGSSLVVTPVTPFQHGVNYRLAVGADVSDLAGNRTGLLNNFDFAIPSRAPVSARSRPPVVLSVYPGYPCPIEAGSRNVGSGIQGRCAGGQTSDDLLPLPSIEPMRAIDVVLSQSLNTGSVRLGASCGAASSFRVERIDSAGNCLGVVSGLLDARPRELHFTPDQPWVVGQLYRYVLGSNNNLTSSVADCSGSQSICGANGLPLQTQLIARTISDARNPQRGGPPMEIWFRGGNSLGGSNIGLRVLPVHDVDANFYLDASERRSNSYSEAGAVLPGLCGTGTLSNRNDDATKGRCVASNGALLQTDRITTGTSFTGAATRFALGCFSGVGSEDEPGGTAGRDCQGNQFLLISASLAARLGSSIDTPTGKAIQVTINPGMVVTSGAFIYADLGLTPNASPGSQALFSALGQIPVLGPLINTAVNTGAGLIDGLLPIGAKDATNTELPEGTIYTGPLVFRMRHPAGNGPILGTIRSVGSKLVLETQLDLYTDIPELNATASILGQSAIPIEHNVRSNVDLSATATPANGSGSIKVSGEVKFLPDGRLTVRLSNKEPVRLTADLSAVGGLLAGALKVRVAAGRFIIDASLAPLKQ